MRVLAGDIGGTKTLLQIADCETGRCRGVREQRFDSGLHDDLSSILREFLKQERKQTIEAVCLGVAGPIKGTAADQSVKVTNPPWSIHSQDLKREFGFPRVRLINDFQAVGYGIEALGAKDLVVLQPGEPVEHGPPAPVGGRARVGGGGHGWDKEKYAQ